MTNDFSISIVLQHLCKGIEFVRIQYITSPSLKSQTLSLGCQIIYLQFTIIDLLFPFVKEKFKH